MAITYTGKNNYTTMRELGEWIRSLKLPNIVFMTSPLTDDLTIMKKEIRPKSGVMELVKPYRIEKMKQRGWVVGRD
jgi:hypothetical protein